MAFFWWVIPSEWWCSCIYFFGSLQWTLLCLKCIEVWRTQLAFWGVVSSHIIKWTAKIWGNLFIEAYFFQRLVGCIGGPLPISLENCQGKFVFPNYIHARETSFKVCQWTTDWLTKHLAVEACYKHGFPHRLRFQAGLKVLRLPAYFVKNSY